jgi:hypothetical protein
MKPTVSRARANTGNKCTKMAGDACVPCEWSKVRDCTEKNSFSQFLACVALVGRQRVDLLVG